MEAAANSQLESYIDKAPLDIRFMYEMKLKGLRTRIETLEKGKEKEFGKEFGHIDQQIYVGAAKELTAVSMKIFYHKMLIREDYANTAIDWATTYLSDKLSKTLTKEQKGAH